MTTLTVAGVGTSGVTLNGSVNPNGLATDAWFEWGESPGLTTFATSPVQAMGAGTSPLPVAATLSGLSPGTTYSYRVVASSAAGAAGGAIATFTTSSPSTFSVVSTSPANGATDVPLGAVVTITFSEDVEPASLVGAVAVSSPAGEVAGVLSYDSTTRTAIFMPGSPLAALTDHAVTVDAKVKAVTTERLGAPYTFTFRSCPGTSVGWTPIPTTIEATLVDADGATLHGTVNPNGLPTRAWFEYGADPALQIHASTAAQDMGNGFTALPIGAVVADLAPGTAHYFRVCAENAAGHSAGQILTFTTASPSAPPAVTTAAATSVGATGAFLNGSVIANGLATSAWFEWGTDPTLAAHVTTDPQDVGSETTSRALGVALSGLVTGTRYYFRAVGSNAAGTSNGAILSFLPGAAPSVTTLTVTGVGTSGVTLNGSVNPNGLATDAWFEWGESPGLTTFAATAVQAVGAGTSPLPVASTLSGLSPGTTYYHRVAASNATGAASGSIVSFTTSAHLAFSVVSTSPANGATDVPLGALVTITFSKDVEPATLVGAVAVSSLAGNVPGVVSYDSTTRTAIFTPGSPLAPLADHAVTVDAKVKAVTTERLGAPYAFTFRTGTGASP